MLSSDALQATIRAERDKEREDNRNAARYVRIRALLDEAEHQINSANIYRNLKNKLVAKLFKARKVLDADLDVSEVIDILAFMVSVINAEMENDIMASENNSFKLKRNFDITENSDSGLLHRSEDESRRLKSDPPSESEEIVIPVVKKVIQNSTTKVNNKKTLRPAGRKSTEFDDCTENDADSDSIASSCSEEVQLINNTLETLTLSLEVLHEMPKLILDKTRHTQLVHTVRATKELLLSEEGCQALLEPFRKLKTSIETGFKGVPKEPHFSEALAQMNIVLSSFQDKT